MGTALAEAFMDKGHSLNIVVRRKEAIDSLLQRGATYCGDINEALESDLIILCLPNKSVAEGIIKQVEPGRLNNKKIINLTTSTPQEAISLKELVTGMGGRYLDGKIECYPAEVGPEKGYIVYSGDEEVFKEVYETLTALSGEPDFVSQEVAVAAVLDMSAVLDMQFAVFYSLMEGLALAMKHGCPVELFLDMAEGTTDGIISVFKRQIMESFANGIPETYEPAKEAALDIEYNALKSVVNSLKESGINASFSEHMLKMMRNTIADGHGDKDMVALMERVYGNNK